MRNQSEQVDDVDESNFDAGEVLLEQGGSRQGLGGDDVTDTAHDNIRFLKVQPYQH